MKVLIVDEMHESIIQMPESLGLKVDYFPNISFEEVLLKVSDYEGLIIRSKFYIDEQFLNFASKLKFIGRAGAGLDLIDQEACKKRGIEIFSANEGNRVAVAEHLIGMLLCLFNNILKSDTEVRNYTWKREENRGEELFGKKVGIIGFGNNGRATAERLIAFGCEIYAYDKYLYGFGNNVINECSLNDIFENADIVSLHIPLTKDTENLFNHEFINKFKKSFYFCNIARGEIMVQKDVLEALNSGKILGACLDVLENEKLKTLNTKQKRVFDELVLKQNVVFSPHIAGWTNQSYIKINQVLRDKIKRFLEN